MIIHKDTACHCTWLVTRPVAAVDACNVVQQPKSRAQRKYNITAAVDLPDAADSSHTQDHTSVLLPTAKSRSGRGVLR